MLPNVDVGHLLPQPVLLLDNRMREEQPVVTERYTEPMGQPNVEPRTNEENAKLVRILKYSWFRHQLERVSLRKRDAKLDVDPSGRPLLGSLHLGGENQHEEEQDPAPGSSARSSCVSHTSPSTGATAITLALTGLPKASRFA